MKINEIFTSIEGEGKNNGEIVTFIRVNGCNLRCAYCDTLYACKNEFKEMSLNHIVSLVKTKNVTITGGEPLLKKDMLKLVKKLVKNGNVVNIETNGSFDVKKYLMDNVFITMDWKVPSSKEQNKMLKKNLFLLRKNDVLKFVCEENDLIEVQKILEEDIKSYIYLSPVFGKCDPKNLVEFAKENYKPKMRVQLQMHKIIWNPNKRGV